MPDTPYEKSAASDYARLRNIHPQLLMALRRGPNVRSASRVLELGCGTGNYISALRRETGCICWGVDPSADMLAQAQSQAIGINYVCAPAESPGLTGARFDLIFCVDAIHHFRDRLRVFREVNRLLSSDGFFGIATESEEIIRDRKPLSIYWPETIGVDLARYPNIHTIHTELRDTGFANLPPEEVYAAGWLSDISAFRTKVFSCLRMLSEDVYWRGLARFEADLAHGPIAYLSRFALLWAKPDGQNQVASGRV